jgi:hypothetical protein
MSDRLNGRLAFAARNDKVFIRAPEIAPDCVVAALMPSVPLHKLLSLDVQQVRLIVYTIDEDISRVAADAERSSPHRKRPVVQMLSGAEIVDVQLALLVHGYQPALIPREHKILGPVRSGPRMDALPMEVPLAYGLLLIKRPDDKRLAVGSPDTAANRLLKPVNGL